MVADTEDEKDSYYHIPELETGSEVFSIYNSSAFFAVTDFAERAGFSRAAKLEAPGSINFARAILSEMLLRDIWEHFNCK